MATKTIFVQIGNSDDKLSQARWAEFIAATGHLISSYAQEFHFAGFSSPSAKWQNACWCLVPASELDEKTLRKRLASLAAIFDQDSIAWAEAVAEFITPTEVSHG